MKTIKQILQERDDMSESEAVAYIAEVQETLDFHLISSGELDVSLAALEDVIMDMLGLEPDYLNDEDLDVY